MVLNRGGSLSKDYFVAYMNLIMNAKECSADEAKEIAFYRLFRGNKDTLGHESYQKFQIAYEAITN